MRSRFTAITLAVIMLAIAPLGVAAKDKDTGISVPITGTFAESSGGVGKFTGKLTIHSFARVNDRVHAIGTIVGTLTDSAGNVTATGLQTVSLPVTLSSGGVAAASTGQESSSGAARFQKAAFVSSETVPTNAARAPTSAAATAQLSCPILRLSIGAIDLNLLGLTVHLNPVLLVISAVPGAGNLLGNLLCAIAGLLDFGGPLAQIVALLNQLLAILSSL